MDDDDIEREERAIYAVAIVTLLPVVVIAILQHVSFDGGTTLCLGGVVLGMIGLVASIFRPVRDSTRRRGRTTDGSEPS